MDIPEDPPPHPFPSKAPSPKNAAPTLVRRVCYSALCFNFKLTKRHAIAAVQNPNCVKASANFCHAGRGVWARRTAATKKGSPIITPCMPIDLAKILSNIGSPHIRPTPSTTWAKPNVLARVSSSVQAVTSDKTATRVP